MSAEKSASQSSRPTTSAGGTSTENIETSMAPKDESSCLRPELPMKPPRHKQKSSQPVETTIDNVDICDDVGNDVSSRKNVCDGN